MRRVISSGSVKAIYIDTEVVLQRVQQIANEAIEQFPEIIEIRLFGSLAKGNSSSLSDVDILIIVDRDQEPIDPIETTKPYFYFFSGKLNIAIDVLVVSKSRREEVNHIVGESKILAKRNII